MTLQLPSILHSYWRFPCLVLFLIVSMLILISCAPVKNNSVRGSKTRIRAPEGMVLIPSGSFIAGSNDPEADDEEKPLRKVYLPGFYMDIYEVTNRQYQQLYPFHSFPAADNELPVTGVLRDQAAAYCACLDKRLPTNLEWEKAARGTDGRVYPWGNIPDAAKANMRLSPSEERSLKPVGSYPLGISPYGCYDLSGNAWEWTGDSFQERDFLGFPTGIQRGVIRGGGYNYWFYQARASYYGFEDRNLTCHDVGFRCAKDFTNN